MRIDMCKDLNKLEKTILSWCKEAGEGVSCNISGQKKHLPITNLNESNIYWQTVKNVFEKLNLKAITKVFPAATDGRLFRQVIFFKTFRFYNYLFIENSFLAEYSYVRIFTHKENQNVTTFCG